MSELSAVLSRDSNTTLVKVKLWFIKINYFTQKNSNTTLVKVKLGGYAKPNVKIYIQIQLLLKLNYKLDDIREDQKNNSNTTLVKVKLENAVMKPKADYLFKYNSC